LAASSWTSATTTIPFGFLRASFELAPAGVQPALRAPGDVDDLGCLPALATLERFADRRAATVVVGRLDHQSAAMSGAGLGDRPEPALLTAGALARDDPEVGRQLVGMIEAFPFADLRAQSQGGQRVNPAQAPQPGDRPSARGGYATFASSASTRWRRAISTSWACR